MALKMTLSLVVVGRDIDELNLFNLNSVNADEIILVANKHKQWGGLGHIWNYYLEHARSSVLGVIHADTALSLEVCQNLNESAESGNVSGIVGRSLDGRYVWSNDIINAPETVSTLDACSMFVKKDIPIRFDSETFDSFHCCVEDFCLQASDAGYPIVVCKGASGHPIENANVVKDQNIWMASYYMYRQRLFDKWTHRKFITT